MAADIQSTVPVLPSLDLQQSVDFYTAKLGFKEVGRYPDYAIVSRDGCEIHFWPCDDRRIAEASSCYIRANTRELYQEFVSKGLNIQEPVVREWGMRELYVIDPHGNLLKFGESV
ncbi:bleomycin resistance protein [Noviherbaspirillum massiliense]|uniref:bleomycin resistance protein n=1 Tax=Noviherbaspirillum massiliense TaxID=1465823 RepID=UPI00037BB0FB|nr:VOC family protein [Noviherbaspirillum massiliense]